MLRRKNEMASFGNREQWRELLPVIQAFVDGVPVQRLGHASRWETVTSLHSLLGTRHRIRPSDLVDGTWEQDYKTKLTSFEFTGTMTAQGSNVDVPKWPSGYELVGEPRFTPDPPAETKQE